jgi:periplasmic divalent cation tolerance protein
MLKYVQILTTTPNKKLAKKIADILLEKKLAACIQILGPMDSTYRWKGKLATSKEYLCLIKSKQSKAGAIFMQLKKLHTYEVPEFIVTPISGGNKEYLRWIDAEIDN